MVKIYFDENEYFECSYDENTFNKIRNIQFNMFKDFIRICDENNLKYHLHAGSILGAIRHEGFIPWDDDIDVGLFREDYEKFLKIIENEYYDKYYLVNLKNEYDVKEDVYTPKSFLCLKNTSVTVNFMYTNNMGIYLDVFAIDLVPKNSIKRFVFIKSISIIHDFIFWFDSFRFDNYYSNFRRLMGYTFIKLFKIFHITPSLILRWFTYLISKQTFNNSSHYCDVSYYYNYPLPMYLYEEFLEVKFESIGAYIPKGYNKILETYYGNYMELPPIEDRKDHNFKEIDFGNYE